MAVDFSMDAALLASAGVDMGIKLWDTYELKLKGTLNGHTQHVSTHRLPEQACSQVPWDKGGLLDGCSYFWHVTSFGFSSPKIEVPRYPYRLQNPCLQPPHVAPVVQRHARTSLARC